MLLASLVQTYSLDMISSIHRNLDKSKLNEKKDFLPAGETVLVVEVRANYKGILLISMSYTGFQI